VYSPGIYSMPLGSPLRELLDDQHAGSIHKGSIPSSLAYLGLYTILA